MDKSLLSAEMVTGGVYMAHCHILAVGDTAAAATVFKRQVLWPQVTDVYISMVDVVHLILMLFMLHVFFL